MKKMTALCLILVLLAGLIPGAMAVNEDVEGKITIYTSMYQFVYEAMKKELEKEFPNLEVEFYYAGTGTLISQIAGEMGDDHTGVLGCDMLLVAEPAYSLELKDYGYLEQYDISEKDRIRFPYDEEGYWYPVRVCNMVLAYNPEKKDEWASRGVNIPKSFRDFAYDPSLIPPEGSSGYISMGDPMTSGTSYAAVVALTDKYGNEYLDKLAERKVLRESGSTAIAKLQDGQCAALMILEESILKYLHDEEEKGHTVTNLEVIYPEDGVILIPSTVMIVAEEFSKNVNTDAAEAVAQWFLSPEGQRMILKGYMHSVLKDMDEVPYHSVSTDELIQKDIGVNWERAFHDREQIKETWTTRITQ